MADPAVDRQHMRRALALAAAHVGRTAPNPAVGAVVLDAAGAVVGEGAHERVGTHHAEVLALRMAGERARGGTLYVTLEPCNHYGRTPPCTDAVLAAGLRRVVIGCVDPNPKVSGQGIRRLEEAGLEVEVGVELEAAEDLIRDFRTWTLARRPFVIHKAALTWDGATASRDTGGELLSGTASRGRVHQLRAAVDAVVVGSGTWRRDDPDLRPRLAAAPTTPWRTVVATDLPAPRGKLLTSEPNRTLWIAGRDPAGHAAAWRDAGAEVVLLGGAAPSPEAILRTLRDRAVHRILLEGGATLARSFLDAGRIDWLILVFGPRLAGGRPDLGLYGGEPTRPLPRARAFRPHRIERVGDDWWVEGPLDNG